MATDSKEDLPTEKQKHRVFITVFALSKTPSETLDFIGLKLGGPNAENRKRQEVTSDSIN